MWKLNQRIENKSLQTHFLNAKPCAASFHKGGIEAPTTPAKSDRRAKLHQTTAPNTALKPRELQLGNISVIW